MADVGEIGSENDLAASIKSISTRERTINRPLAGYVLQQRQYLVPLGTFRYSVSSLSPGTSIVCSVS